MTISREQYIETAKRAARDMGWSNEIVVNDMGDKVELMLSAPGACEQVVTAKLSGLVRAVQEGVCAADVPVVVEYDIDKIGYAGHEDPDGTPEMAADAAVQAAVDAGDPDPFREDDLNGADEAARLAEIADHADEPAELEKDRMDEIATDFQETVADMPESVREIAREPITQEVKPVKATRKPNRADLVARCKALGVTGYSGLRAPALKALIRNAERMQGAIEDTSGIGIEPATIMSPKETAQAALVDDQDRGGLPQSQQVLQAAGTKKSAAQLFAELDSVIEFEGRTIIARQGNDTRVMGSRIEAGVKARWEREGWTFTHVSKEDGRTLLRALTSAKRAAAGIGKAPVSITHRSGEALVERRNGRTYAKPGYVFRVFKGDKSFEVATVNEALWRSKGWNLAVKAV